MYHHYTPLSAQINTSFFTFNRQFNHLHMGGQSATDKEFLVSIVIATFNAAGYLPDCIQSVIALNIPDLEIVVVDGGSTDGTLEIIRSFNNGNITWISEPDKGIYDALNKGTKLARGKWLHFLGADDRLLPGFRDMTGKLRQGGSNVVYYGNSDAYYGPGPRPSYILLTGPFSKYRLAKYCMNHQAILYPATVFRKYAYDLQYKVFADYAVNIQLWGDADFVKQYHPFTVALYNMTGFSSVTSDAAFIRDKAELIRKNFGLGIYLRFLYKRFKKKLEGAKDFQ